MKKRSFLFFLIIHYCIISLGQVEKTVFYYDSDWNGVADSSFATYKRCLIVPKDTMFKKRVMDYYITGELQGEGSFISIDKYDDKKSIFDGKCFTYFKNGKKNTEGNYKDGLLNGDFIVYFEDGTIKSKNCFVNGKMHGTQLYFTQDGQSCIKEEYEMGEHTKPYYTSYFPNGTSARFFYADDKPYYDSPTLADEEFSNGIHVIRANDIEVRVKVLFDNAWFYHFILFVNIINNSGNTISFEPSETKLYEFKKGEDVNGNRRTYSALSGFEVERYIIERKQRAAGLLGALNAFQAGSAGYQTTNTYSNGGVNFSGHSQVRAYAYGNGGYVNGYANGMYSGNANYHSQSTARSYNSTEAFQARVLAQQQMQTTYDAIPNSAKQFTESYISHCTLHSGEYVSGQYWIPNDGKVNKNRSYILVVPVNGINYPFSVMLRDGTDRSGQSEWLKQK